MAWILGSSALGVRSARTDAPLRDLVYLGRNNTLVGDIVEPIPDRPTSYRLRSDPPVFIGDSNAFIWANLTPVPFVQIFSYLYSHDGYIAFPGSGDLFTQTQSSTIHQELYAWSGELGDPSERNVIIGLEFDTPTGGGNTTVSGGWDTLDLVDPTSSVPVADLRNNQHVADTHNIQSLRLGHVRSASSLDVVASTVGGSVLLIDPETSGNPIVAESTDYGFGGMALLVIDLNDPPDGKDEIVFANLTAPIHPVSSPLYAWVTILRESAGSLIEVGRFPVGYAASGLAAADLDGDQQGLGLVITTIEGDLVVLDLTTDGQFNGVHHRQARSPYTKKVSKCGCE